jgi:hypothetical protein
MSITGASHNNKRTSTPRSAVLAKRSPIVWGTREEGSAKGSGRVSSAVG